MRVDSRIGEGISGAIYYDVSEGKDDDGKPKPKPGAGGVGATAIGRAEVLEGFNLGLTLADSRLLGMSEEQYVEFARAQMEWNGRAETQGSKRQYCAQDCLHASLSWAPGETPTKKQKIDTARKYLAAIGLADAQAIVIEHHDRKRDRKGNPRAAHIHITASLVDIKTGKAIPAKHRGLRERHFAVEYEERMHADHGWAIPKGHQWRHDQRAATRGVPDYDELFELLFKNKSVITTYALDLALAFGGHFGVPAREHHKAFVAHHKLIPLANYPGGPVAAYTTSDIQKREWRVMGLAKKLHRQTGFAVPDSILEIVAKKFHLDDEQCVSLRHLTRDNGFAIQTGNAGTGKSHVICKAVREAYRMMGRGYGGTAFTNNNVLDMRHQGLQEALTLDTLLMKWKFSKPDSEKAIFKRGDVLAVEEAGQTNVFHLDQLYQQAERRGIKIILSGDDKQMSPVQRGTMFPVHVKQFGTSTLTKVWRNPGKQREWDAMADGVKARGQKKTQEKMRTAVEGLKEKGAFHFFDTRADAIEGIAQQYEKDRAAHPERSQLILGHTNEDVKDLTAAVIKLQTERGLRGPETTVETSKGPVGYAIGDRIMLKDNHLEPKVRAKGFANGALGTVIGAAVEPDGRSKLTVDLDRPAGAQKRVFEVIPGLDKEAGEYDTARGIAGTNFVGQGKSIDHVYPLFNPIASSNADYVAMTRDKKEVYVGVSREDTPGYDGLVAQMSQGGPKRAAASYYPVEAPAPTEPPTPAPQIPPTPSPPLAPEPEPEPHRAPEPTLLPAPAEPKIDLSDNGKTEPNLSDSAEHPVSASEDASNPTEKINITDHVDFPDHPVGAEKSTLPEPEPAPEPQPEPPPAQIPHQPAVEPPPADRVPDPIPAAQETPVAYDPKDDEGWPQDPQEERFRAQHGAPSTSTGWPGIRPGEVPPPGMDGPTHGPDEDGVGTGRLKDHTWATATPTWSQMIGGFLGDRLDAPGVDPYWPKPKIEISGDEPMPEPETPGPIHQGIPEPMPAPSFGDEIRRAYNIQPEPPQALPSPTPRLPPPEPEPDPGYGM